MAGISANHPNHTFAADDFAVPADLFDGSSNFHDNTQMYKAKKLTRYPPYTGAT
jgi:hypothetical protein